LLKLNTHHYEPFNWQQPAITSEGAKIMSLKKEIDCYLPLLCIIISRNGVFIFCFLSNCQFEVKHHIIRSKKSSPEALFEVSEAFNIFLEERRVVVKRH